MKRWIIAFYMAALGTLAHGQGLVNFVNSSTTLISYQAVWMNPPSGVLPGGAPGSYFFALMTAPVGDVNVNHFQFAGVYATNTVAEGRISGGLDVPVIGWAAGQARNYLVVGWPSFLGSNFNTVFAGLTPSQYASYCSPIAMGVAGGFDGVGALPAWSLFGSSPALGGFAIQPIPEPGSALLVLFGAVLIRTVRRGNSRDRSVR